MSNTGSAVAGFAVAQSDMGKFDRLPPNIRQALNDARAEWSVDYFAQWVPMLGAGTVCAMIERSDDEWARAAYAERGFEAKEIAAQMAADRGRAK